MNDLSLSEHAPGLAAEPERNGPPVQHLLADLEQRVQALEESVASLRDTRQLEERITERVTTRLPPPPPPEPVMSESVLQTAVQSSWLLLDLIGEVRTMLGMFFDGRYHVAWVTRVTSIVLLVAIFTSYWWFPLSYLPVIGYYVTKALDLCLALLLFLLLNREARRYREWRVGRR